MDVNQIQSPDFLKDLNVQELQELSKDIRTFLIESISKTGGHLASNLGMVECSIALLKAFNLPEDTVIYDVGHQVYTHKILTGRAERFSTLRQFKGLSGFPKREESIYDAFETGHSSTSISLAAGKLVSNALQGKNNEVIAVIGDGALTGGMAFEAMNYLGSTNHKVIVVLNDNEYSINKNVGAMSSMFNKIRVSKSYQSVKRFLPKPLRTFGHALDYSLAGVNVFESLGFDYYGPVDGHDFVDLEKAFSYAKKQNRSVLIHLKTRKGHGMPEAENDQVKYHGISYFKIEKETKGTSWSKAIAKVIHEESPQNLTVITPAMIYGSGLELFKDRNLIDVGIAEGHAATMASAIALDGMPVFLPLYSTFSQRAFDSFAHDIARMNAPMLIGIDRSGFVPNDGDTHQGIFDVSMFKMLPNVIITMPKDIKEAKELVRYGWKTNAPFVIRYPKGSIPESTPCEPISSPTWLMERTGEKCNIISYGNTLHRVLQLVDAHNLDCTVINARFIKPMDLAVLDKLTKPTIVIEEVIEAGSLGESIQAYCSNIKVTRLAIQDYPSHGSIADLQKEAHLDDQTLLKEIVKQCV